MRAEPAQWAVRTIRSVVNPAARPTAGLARKMQTASATAIGQDWMEF